MVLLTIIHHMIEVEILDIPEGVQSDNREVIQRLWLLLRLFEELLVVIGEQCAEWSS